jgi:hypothetical protein
MAPVKRKTASHSVADLVRSLHRFIELLDDEDDEAADVLKGIAGVVESNATGSDPFKDAIQQLLEAYDGDLELRAYTTRRKDAEWTPAEALYLASVDVLNLAKRFSPSAAR